MECRKRSLTYSAPIFVDIKYTLGDKIMMKRGLRIGQMPIMLHSSKCVLRNKTPSELAKMQECLYDPGGYFIVRGAEKVLLMQEQMSKNRILMDKNDDGTIVVSETLRVINTRPMSLVPRQSERVVVMSSRRRAVYILSITF